MQSHYLFLPPYSNSTSFNAEELELVNYPISVIQEKPAVFFTGNVKHSKSPVHFFSFVVFTIGLLAGLL